MSASEPTVFLNDQFLPASQAHINIFDLGVVLGATLTEMTRTFAHKSFRLEDHVDRLYRSMKYAGIAPLFDAAEMVAKTEELIARNTPLLDPDQDQGVVHFTTPGENQLYAGSAGASARRNSTLCIHTFPLPFGEWRHFFTDGAHVITPAIRHIPPQCIDPKMKNRSRLHWWIADQQSHAVDPKATTLLLDLDGNLTECSGANFVLLNGRTVYSPTSRNILEGVSLVTVRELAAEMGWNWVEKDLQPYDVVNADEAWLTTTPYCMAPVTRINNQPIGSGRPGPLFREMLNAWSAKLDFDILAQIMGEKA